MKKDIEKIKEDLIKEISDNHAKIIDDFGKAYISSRWKDYFSKQKKIDFRRLELVQDMSEFGKTIYYFRLKPGKLKKIGLEK